MAAAASIVHVNAAVLEKYKAQFPPLKPSPLMKCLVVEPISKDPLCEWGRRTLTKSISRKIIQLIISAAAYKPPLGTF